MAGVALDSITKIYPGADGPAVSKLDLEVEDGEFLVLVGPSGCGKTTALRMVAGLEDITEGELRIGDRVVNDVPSRDRDIAMVFQSYALYPHLSVFENIAFGLRIQKVPKDEVNRRVREASRSLGLDEYLLRKPKALSGGQRQRVAMGRAIVRQPAAFLMDEPLSNLDAKLRVQTRAEIARLQQDLGVTTIYVTHDQTEALTMGHRVAVMKAGVLQQVAPPQELYDRPVNLFVGGFIGSPSMNLVVATIRRRGEAMHAELRSGASLALDPELVRARPALAAYVDREVVLGIRPEEIEDVALDPSAPADRRLTGQLRLREALGSEIMAHLEIDARPARTDAAADLQDELTTPALEPEAGGAPFVARFGPRSTASVGDRVEMRVDTRNLHFFDPATELGIYDESPGDPSHHAPPGSTPNSQEST